MFQSRNLWYNTEKPGKAVQLMKMEQLIGILSILLQLERATAPETGVICVAIHIFE